MPRPSAPSTRLRRLAGAVAACFAAPVLAQLPTRPVVVNGTATFVQSGNTLTVTNSNGAIINWNTFSIGAGHTTNFVQPSAASSVLNRVLSADPSVLLGTLSSNGKVWLINPAGILVGAGARIDVGGFVGSTLNVRNEDFLAGRLSFEATPGAGSVQNHGSIATPSGGSVYLVAPNVENHGIITTPQGETILAAGEKVSLVDTATPGVKVEIAGAQGNATNLGTILAESGRVGMAGVLVKNSGRLSASSVVSEGGRVFLRATQDTYVDGAGRIEATGTKGGRVEVLGERVAVMDQASIDASGVRGGGTVLVGGDYQGKNPEVQNAAITYFGGQASIKADATGNGDGGKVIVWADDTTRAYGRISARGGAEGGNGGFVENSGHRYLDFQGFVDTRAPKGKAGLLLLDPSDITIDNSSDNLAGGSFSGGWFSGATTNATLTWSTINTQLGLGGLEIRTNSAGAGGNGDIFINASGTLTNSNYLVLLANRNITFAPGAVLTGIGEIDLISGWNNSGWAVTPGTGTIAFNSGSGLATAGDVYMNVGGALNVQAGASINVGGSLRVGTTGTATYGNVNIYGTVETSGAEQVINTTGNVTVAGTAGGAARLSYLGSGSQTISADGMLVQAAGVGNDNSASIRASGGAQTISVGAGGLTLAGGGGVGAYNNFANISQDGAAGSQTITVTSGTLAVTGGSGNGMGSTYYDAGCGAACSGQSSHNNAAIWNKGSGGQTINFVGAGNLNITGGSAGNDNYAAIESDSSQTITGSAAITLLGGASGGAVVRTAAKDYYLSNEAGLFADGTQTITAGSLTLTGSSAAKGGAIVAAPVQTISTTGNVSLTGGGTALNTDPGAPFRYVATAPAVIGNGIDGVSSNLTLNVGGDLTLTGGAVGTYGGSLAMLGGWDVPATVLVNGQQSVTLSGAGARIGSNTGAASVTLRSGLGGTGTMSLSDGQVVAGTTGSVTLLAAGTGAWIDQTAAGKIVAGTLNATAAPVGSINLLGVNEVTSVTATAPGNITYNSAVGTHLSLQSTGGGTLTVTADNATNDAFLGIGVLSTSGTVNVTADGSILDDNGGGVANVIAGSASLTSTYGGLSSGIAISADTQVSGGITATVPAGATYGGISIRNQVASYSGVASLSDQAASGNGIDFSNTGDITIVSTASFNAANGGHASVYAGGNLTYTGPAAFSAASPISLGAGSNLTVGGALSVSGDLKLSAGGILSIPTSAASTGASVSLTGATIDVTGTVSAATGVTITGTDFVADGGSVSAGQDIVADLTGDMRLNNGSWLDSTGGNVKISLTGGASGLYLNDAPAMPNSTINVGAAGLIDILLLGRSVGGIVIDGVETQTFAAGGSGFFAGGSPAVLGSNLQITYGIVDPTVANALADSLPQGSTSGTEADGSTTVVLNDAPQQPATSTLLTDTTQTIGGTEGTFGGTGDATAGTTTTNGTATTDSTTGTATGTAAADTTIGTAGTATDGTATAGDGSVTTAGEPKDAAAEKKEERRDAERDSGKGKKRDERRPVKKLAECTA